MEGNKYRQSQFLFKQFEYSLRPCAWFFETISTRYLFPWQKDMSRTNFQIMKPFILLPDYVLDLLGELPGNLVLHLVHLVDQQTQPEWKSQNA